MLDACAPGYAIVEKPHKYWVLYNGRTFRALPKGKQGSDNPEIERGHIKKMIRALGIDQEHARKFLHIFD